MTKPTRDAMSMKKRTIEELENGTETTQKHDTMIKQKSKVETINLTDMEEIKESRGSNFSTELHDQFADVENEARSVNSFNLSSKACRKSSKRMNSEISLEGRTASNLSQAQAFTDPTNSTRLQGIINSIHFPQTYPRSSLSRMHPLLSLSNASQKNSMGPYSIFSAQNEFSHNGDNVNESLYSSLLGQAYDSALAQQLQKQEQVEMAHQVELLKQAQISRALKMSMLNNYVLDPSSRIPLPTTAALLRHYQSMISRTPQLQTQHIHKNEVSVPSLPSMQEYFSRDVDSKNKKDYGGISTMFGAQGTETVSSSLGEFSTSDWMASQPKHYSSGVWLRKSSENDVWHGANSAKLSTPCLPPMDVHWFNKSASVEKLNETSKIDGFEEKQTNLRQSEKFPGAAETANSRKRRGRAMKEVQNPNFFVKYAEKGSGLKTGNENNVFVRTCDDSTISNLNLKGSKILPAEVEIIDLASSEKEDDQDEEGDTITQVEHEVMENEDSSEISIGKNDNAIEIRSLQDDSVPSIQKSPSDQTKIDEDSSVDVLDNNEDNQGNSDEKKEETIVNSNEQYVMKENHIKKKVHYQSKSIFHATLQHCKLTFDLNESIADEQEAQLLHESSSKNWLETYIGDLKKQFKFKEYDSSIQKICLPESSNFDSIAFQNETVLKTLRCTVEDAKIKIKEKKYIKEMPEKNNLEKFNDSIEIPRKPQEINNQLRGVILRKSSFVIPSTIEESVMRASSLIAAELREGIWSRNKISAFNQKGVHSTKQELDSGVVDIEISKKHNGYDYENEKDDLKSRDEMKFDRSLLLLKTSTSTMKIAVSLEKFAVETIVPSLLAAGVQDGGDGPHRAFLATLLSIREVLAMNADDIFSLTKGSFQEDNSIIETKKEMDETSLFYSFTANTLATALILSSLQRLGEKSISLIEEFKYLSHGYDSANPMFTSCFNEVTREVQGIRPDGTKLSPEENKIWGIHLNQAWKNHPLSLESKLSIPKPTGCGLYLVEDSH